MASTQRISPQEVERILHAACLAADAHAIQRRKTSDEPYIIHPLRVARKVASAGFSADVIIAALLHDTVEDTALTLEDLESEFSPRAIHLVRLMTQWWSDDASQATKASEAPKYYAAIVRDYDATSLKLFDRADNLDDMTNTITIAPRWAQRYLSKSTTEMQALLNSPAHPEAKKACRDAMARLKQAVERYNQQLHL